MALKDKISASDSSQFLTIDRLSELTTDIETVPLSFRFFLSEKLAVRCEIYLSLSKLLQDENHIFFKQLGVSALRRELSRRMR